MNKFLSFFVAGFFLLSGSAFAQVGGTSGGGSSSPTASELHLGEMGWNAFTIKTAMTTTASGAYTTGKSIGGLQTLANAVRVSGTLGNAGTGARVVGTALMITNPSLTGAAADVYLFDANPTGSTCTDNTTFALVAADLQKVIDVVHIGDFTSGNTGVVGKNTAIASSFSLSSATSIYACVVLRDSFTLPAGTGNGYLTLQLERN